MRTVLLVFLTLLATGCALQAPVPRIPQGEAGYRAAAQVKSDELDPSVRITLRSPFTAPGRADVDSAVTALVATIDKRTAVATLAVGTNVTHRSGAWLNLHSASYIAADGQAARALGFRPSLGDVDCRESRAWGSCRYQESAMFVIELAELRSVATQSPSGGAWRVRFATARGSLDAELPTEMVSAFVQLVDEHRTRLLVAARR